MDLFEKHKLKFLLGIPGGYIFINGLVKWYKRRQIYGLIDKQRQKCQKAFETVEEEVKHLGLEPKERQRIFDLTSLELQQELQNGQITASDVLQVYQLQMLNVNQKLNAVIEPLVNAKDLATSCDQNSAEKGVLFGIPFSIKENLEMKGLSTTGGMAHLLTRSSVDDSVIVKVIKSQGGVPFVRTNIPQTMMTYESSNPIYGRTNNPFNTDRVPGGSSSGEAALIGAGASIIDRVPGGSSCGEAALIGAGASIIGIGSDVGGSIRVPCHFCGCYGLKTTGERLSVKGGFSFGKGQTMVRGAHGPMSRDMDGLVIAMKGLLCDLHFQLDREVPPIHFRDEMYESTKPLTIGFYTYDGFTHVVPAVERAVLMAKQALEAQGHTVVEFTPPRVQDVIPELYMGTVSCDRGEQFLTYLNKDIVDPTIRDLMIPIQGPKWLTSLLSWVIQLVGRDKNTARMLRNRNGKSSVYQWFQHAIKIQKKETSLKIIKHQLGQWGAVTYQLLVNCPADKGYNYIMKYRHEFFAAWQQKKLDAVICPPFACAAVPHRSVVKIIGAAGSYSMLYNILNYPAGTVPVTRVLADDISNMKNYPKSSASQKFMHQVTQGSEGLPVGVQCVTLPFTEEQTLRVMKDLTTGLKQMEKR